MSFNVAIDGPAGAGKSTVAKAVAAKRNFIYVDTGAMYRTMALYFLRKGVDKNDEAAVNKACMEVSISIAYENGAQQVFLNGENVSGLIRTEEVGNMASATSGYLFVREKLVELQKEMARKSDVVMDGRDIGTCVLPEADVKVYLTASSLVRARRRYRELTEKGMAVRENVAHLASEELDFANYGTCSEQERRSLTVDMVRKLIKEAWKGRSAQLQKAGKR